MGTGDRLHPERCEFGQSKPFEGKKRSVYPFGDKDSLFMPCAKGRRGADVCDGANPLSTQDDVAAALVKAGFEVHAWYDCTGEEERVS